VNLKNGEMGHFEKREKIQGEVEVSDINKETVGRRWWWGGG